MTPAFAITALFVVAAQAAAPAPAGPEPAPAAAPTQAERPRVLVLQPSGDAVDASVRETVASLVSIELAKEKGIDVVTSSDVKKMAALEADKQSVGCDDSGSCLAELAGAMGARFIVFGDAAKLGTLTVVNLSLFDSAQARAVARVSIQVTGLEELPQRIPSAVRELIAGAPDLAAVASSSAVAQSAVVEPPAGAPMWATVGMFGLIGAGALIGGMGLLFDVTSTTSGNGVPDAFDTVGPVAYVVAVSAIGGGLALGLLTPPEAK